MSLLLLAHLVAGLGLLAIGPRLGRAAFALAALPMAATFWWLLTRLPAVVDGGVVTQRLDWIPELGLGVDLRLDGFGAVMVALVAGIGTLVVAYADGYFHPHGARSVRLLGLLVLFAGSMLGLVIADNLLVLYGFWELTSITSFLLIGHKSESATARAAALQALLITGLGGLAMLGGFILVGQAAGTYSLSGLLAAPPRGTTVTVGLVLILLGAFTKSAQFPFHSWLPGAMVAPTPISAYLHSATMVKAGLYLVARLAPAFATVGLWRPLVVAVGAVTMIGGGMRALRQTDLKLLLAMGTISQLGFMMVVLGWGSFAAAAAGSTLLLSHGLFKGALFMVVGVVDHQAGTRDVRRIPSSGPGWGVTMAVAVVAAASMAGVPLMFGFVAKEADFEALLDGGTGGRLALAAMVVGSVLTAAYSIRFVLGITGRLRLDEPIDDEETMPERTVVHARPPRPAFAAPAAVLTVGTVVFGLRPGLLDRLVDASTDALTGAAAAAEEAVRLAIWHGFTTALALSVVALATGAVIAVAVAGRRHEPAWFTRPADAVARRPSSGDAYRRSLRALNTAADRITAVAQPGSLPIYLGVILVTAVAVPGIAMVRRPWWPGWPPLVDTPLHLAVVPVVLGFAVAAALVRRRFSAALFLSMCGYGMAGLFLVHGAPDLALTQVAIETLTTVLFVLVLRRLPDRFEGGDGLPRQRILRLVVAATVGAAVFAFTMAIAGDGGRTGPTAVSDVMIADAYPEADGRNIVNVILVDFRGLDTLGELTVLAAAAIGTVALARAGRRPGQRPDVARPTRGAPQVTIDVAVRVVFAAIVLGSWWLLFAGHNQPGGGFVGGIVAGAALSLRYVAGGLASVRVVSRGQPWVVLGGGVLIAALSAAVPLTLGGAVLQSDAWTWDLPVLGTVKLTSPLFFDIGVYLAVVGLALMVFESFGDDPAIERQPIRGLSPSAAEQVP